jgi:hypothetical protein
MDGEFQMSKIRMAFAVLSAVVLTLTVVASRVGEGVLTRPVQHVKSNPVHLTYLEVP